MNQLELVGRARKGDSQAYGLLVERHWAQLVRLACSMIGAAAAEDVVQDSLLVGWRKLSRLRCDAAFTSWVNRIVFRACLHHCRQQTKNPEYPPHGQRCPSIDPSGRIDVERVLLQLTPRQRAVLYLTVVEGMTDLEIGVRLGIRRGSVRAHRRRARNKMKAWFGEEL